MPRSVGPWPMPDPAIIAELSPQAIARNARRSTNPDPVGAAGIIQRARRRSARGSCRPAQDDRFDSAARIQRDRRPHPAIRSAPAAGAHDTSSCVVPLAGLALVTSSLGGTALARVSGGSTAVPASKDLFNFEKFLNFTTIFFLFVFN